VARITAQATDEGWARDRIAAVIMDNPVFDYRRAVLVARTETERAYNQGNLRGYRESGVVREKGWIGAADCCDECMQNQGQGYIGLEDNFESGDDAPPAHPNCRCRIIPRVGAALGEQPPLEEPEGFQPTIVDTEYTPEERKWLDAYAKADPNEYAELRRWLQDKDHCPVVLTPEVLRANPQFQEVAQHMRQQHAAGAYYVQERRLYVFPEYREKVLVHEVAHQYQDAVIEHLNADKAGQITDLYLAASRRGKAVTDYALTNSHEYFADSMRAFLKSPADLRLADPAMYEFLNTKVLRGVYK
jgi:SPP1 gp7 family putative phage head morphogenesis protein